MEETIDERRGHTVDVMPSSVTPPLFTVVVADNFHYMDESETYEHGKFETLEAAITAAKAIVDDFLLSALKPGMAADQLYEQYVHFGDDPFIRGGSEGGVLFSAWSYARERCTEMCPGT